MNKRLPKLLLLLTLAILTTGVLGACTKKIDEDEDQAKKQVNVQKIVPQSEVVSTLTASGVVVPKQYSAIRSLVQGTLEYIAPVGAEISSGIPLFRIRDDSVENAHFNALQSLQQTQILTTERVSQSKLNLNSIEARFVLAERNLENIKKQSEQTSKNAKDSAVVTYNSAYNALKQFFSFTSVGSIENFDYKYKNISTTDNELKETANLQYDAATKLFLKLSVTIDKENIDQYLTQMDTVLEATKQVADSTTVLLQNALGGVENLISDKSVVTSYQTQINTHTSTVINSQNALRNTVINNDLVISQSENQLELSKIELSNAQIGLENAKNSADLEKIISQSQFDNAAYSFNNLSLGSPFAGTVLSNSIEAGQQVSVGQEILELGNLGIVEIEVEIDSEFAKGLKQGDAVKINELYDGLIAELEPTGSIESGKVGVTIQSANTEGFLVASDIAEVTFNLVYKEDSLIIIPIKAAAIESTNTYVFVVQDGKALKRTITLGKIFGNKVSVTAGLAEGDLVILKNGTFISEDDEVEVQE